MAVFRIESEDDVESVRVYLQSRLSRQHEVMRECDYWHTRDEERLKTSIWRGVAENVKRHTVVSLVPQSIKNACVAFTASRQPKIRAVPVNTLSAPELSAANFSERVGYAIWHTLNRHRQTPLAAETAEYGYGRAVMIGKACWLTPEQRGDERVEKPIPMLDPLPFQDETGMAPEEDVLYETTYQGEFPVLVQLYDPLDCLWSQSRDGSTRQFMHISRMNWDEVVDLYPDILEKEPWTEKNTISDMQEVVEVIDYWDETDNCILVEGQFYKKPTPHDYPYCPIIIERVNVHPVRSGTLIYSGSSIVNATDSSKQMVATPITWDILPAAADHSHTLSITGTYVEYGVFGTYVHEGIDPENSPYMQVVGDAQEPEYVNKIALEPGSMMPTFLNERVRPMEQARVNEQLLFYQQEMANQMALSGFHVNFLTGTTPVGGPDSGYGIVQQRIATTAKMTTTSIGVDRFLSRLFTLIKDIIVYEWDYGEAPLILSQMMGEGKQAAEVQTPVTKEAFEAVREIVVEVVPDVPLNDEQEKTAIFQANSQGLMSDYRAIEKLSWADDPEEEQKRIAAEMVVKTDPLFGPPIRLAMAADWMTKNGMGDVAANIKQAAQAMSAAALAQLAPQPPPQATPPPPSLPGGVGVVPSPAPAMPGMDPSMMGGMAPGMAPPMDPMAMGGMPPEMMGVPV